MHALIPPICFVLALAMLIAGFALWAVEAPEPGPELSRARATGDDQYGDVLETQLKHRQWSRKMLLGCLFAGSGLMTIVGFFAIRSPNE